MMFIQKKNIKYVVGESTSIGSISTGLRIKKMLEQSDWKYSLSIDHHELELFSENMARNADANLEFTIDKADFGLESVNIRLKSEVSLNQDYTYETCLVVRACRENIEYKERSCKFQVTIKKKGKVLRLKKDFKISADVSDQLFPPIFTLVVKAKDEDSTITPIAETDHQHSETDISNPPETLCLVINSIDFLRESLQRRAHSLQTLSYLNDTFGNVSNCYIRGTINATTEGLFRDMDEFINEPEHSYDQVVVFVMSHGHDDKFCMRNGDIDLETFTEELKTKIRKVSTKKVILSGTCNKSTPIPEGPSFYNSAANLSDSSSSDSSPSLSATLSPPKSPYSNKWNSDLELYNSNQGYPTLYELNESTESTEQITSSDDNLLLCHAAERGGVCFVLEDGNVYFSVLLRNINESIDENGFVNLEDEVRRSERDIKEMKFIMMSDIIQNMPPQMSQIITNMQPRMSQIITNMQPRMSQIITSMQPWMSKIQRQIPWSEGRLSEPFELRRRSDYA